MMARPLFGCIPSWRGGTGTSHPSPILASMRDQAPRALIKLKAPRLWIG